MAPSVSSIEAASTATPFLVFDWNPGSKWSQVLIDYLGDTSYFDRVSDFDSLVDEYLRRTVPSSQDFERLESYFKMHICRDDSVDFISKLMVAIVNDRKVLKCAV
jgi:hypothetical protein